MNKEPEGYLIISQPASELEFRQTMAELNEQFNRTNKISWVDLDLFELDKSSLWQIAKDARMDKETLERLYKKSFDEPPLDNVLFPPSMYYRFLRLLASEMKSKLSVELGVSGGGGSLHLALGNLAGITVGIDQVPMPEQQDATIMVMCGDAFRFFRGDSIKSASLVHSLYGEVDILFIDTIHTKEQTIAELEAWRPYLSKDAVVCFDDLHRSEMKGFWNDLPEPKTRMDKLHDGAEFGGGFGVIWNIK